ncbi:hypothetical protein [Sphingobacterium sp. UBA6645]|uniref:hypothetical protein n=1 Tax=Sphingobacterium sp. UBA6645 TaxID=1947511 RepID=UPI0025E6556B|nr:hypothetical protein [Sphingobacterium sp. UBA6645]
MDSTQIEQYLSNLEDQLIKQSKRVMLLPLRNWEYQLPKEPAVYIFIEGNEICYVGEAEDLRLKMRKFCRHKNDRFKRAFGIYHFSNHPDLALSKGESFSEETSALIANKISELLTFAYIKVELGRAELKDLLNKKMNTKYPLTLRKSGVKSIDIKELRKTYQNAFKRWSRDEDQLLESLFYENKPIKELSDIFKRQSSAIRRRIEKLKL